MPKVEDFITWECSLQGLVNEYRTSSSPWWKSFKDLCTSLHEDPMTDLWEWRINTKLWGSSWFLPKIIKDLQRSFSSNIRKVSATISVLSMYFNSYWNPHPILGELDGVATVQVKEQTNKFPLTCIENKALRRWFRSSHSQGVKNLPIHFVSTFLV